MPSGHVHRSLTSASIDPRLTGVVMATSGPQAHFCRNCIARRGTWEHYFG
jgi:hypothetical protein